MRTLRIALVALAALRLSAAASADDRPRLGVGVGLSTFDFNVTTLANGFPAAVPDSIYVPINLTPTFRLEPQIGAVTINQNTGSGGGVSIEESVVSLGIGVFWLVPAGSQFDLTLGARVVRTSYTLKQKPASGAADTTEGTDLRIIPAVGGELSLHPRFSLGAEVQLQLVSFGDRSVSGGGTIPGGSGVQTAGLLFARVYLF